MQTDMIVLFDFDGVIADTESQYTIFWDKKGKEYLGLDNFGLMIKGEKDTASEDERFIENRGQTSLF